MAREPTARRAHRLAADAIVAAAMRVARDEGLPALSMRRLAEELESSPMSLYRHIADRQTLLVRMLDVVADEVVATSATIGPPRDQIVSIMESLHAAFSRDPWVVAVLVTEGLASPRILPVVEALFGALRAAGLSGAAALEGYALLFHYTFGEATVRHHERPDSYADRMVRSADPAHYPHIAAILAAAGDAPRDDFRSNLSRLLDGLLPSPG